MKVIIVLSAIVACAVANDLGYGGHSYAAAPIVSKVLNVNNGESQQYRSQDAWGNYEFGYNEQHHDGAWGSGGSSRHEKSDAWNNKVGSYSLNVGDGRQRVVKYVADGAGFRASIKTNEPGIVASAPAATSISTPHGHDAVPAPLGHAIAAPVAVASNVAGYAAPLTAGYSDGLALNAGLGHASLGHAGLGHAGYAGLGLAGGYGLAGNGLAGAGLGY